MGRAPHDEEDLGELLSLMRPPPDAWVAAAKDRPRIEGALEQILALAEADAEFRRALVADLDTALRDAGFEPDREMARALRERLGQEGTGT